MPPALPEDDASVSGDEEIPFRGKQAATEEEDADVGGEEDEEEGDEDGEDGEEEYVVEKILSHQFDEDDKPFYEVKWQGYEKKADRTWEPEENLEGAQEALEQYYEKIGGKPEPGESAAPKKGKRKQSVESSATPKAKGGRGRKKQKVENGDEDEAPTGKAGKAQKWEPPRGSWEQDIMNIDCIEEEYDASTKKNKRVGFVMWNNGRKSKHSLNILNGKCPQKLLHYYEQHLVFRNASTKNSANGAEPETEDVVDLKKDEE
ncbi:MAG: hypothetical protein M1820_001365 [Bogoriella megaspora]|nr:MAG: hypothetical protein M1820_001365 [Bogoriella megaspora]